MTALRLTSLIPRGFASGDSTAGVSVGGDIGSSFAVGRRLSSIDESATSGLCVTVRRIDSRSDNSRSIVSASKRSVRYSTNPVIPLAASENSMARSNFASWLETLRKVRLTPGTKVA